jgi:HD-like signal output (HDOD) protein
VCWARHDELGAELLELWNFPAEIVKAVARHHGSAEDDALTQVLQIAQVLAGTDVHEPHDPTLDDMIVEWGKRLDLTQTEQSTAA